MTFVNTKKEEVLDSQYANMIPEWKSGGILFIRQQSVADYISRPMDIKQSLYRYRNGHFTELEMSLTTYFRLEPMAEAG